MADEPSNPALRGKRLYLFSSNAQPLYAQNVLNSIAAPRGHVQTARYGAEWLNEEAREHWSRMAGLPVLLHFCLLHTSEYFEPAFFPVRCGRVVNADTDGDYFFVDIERGEDVSLRWSPDEAAEPVRDAQRFLPALDDYRNFLATREIQRPYDGSATLAEDFLPDAGGLFATGRDVDHFRRNAEFLARTESFADALFLKFLRVKETGSDKSIDYAAGEDGRPRFRLKGGTAHVIQFFSYQPRGLDSVISFTATVGDDAAVRIVGTGRVELASKFDRPELVLQTGRPSGGQTLVTTLAIDPPDGVMGPHVNLLLEVSPAGRDRLLNLLGPLAVLLPIAAATFVADTVPKLALVAIGIVFAVVLQWFGVTTAPLISPTTAAARPAPPPER